MLTQMQAFEYIGATGDVRSHTRLRLADDNEEREEEKLLAETEEEIWGEKNKGKPEYVLHQFNVRRQLKNVE